MEGELILDGRALTTKEVLAAARHGLDLRISEDGLRRVELGRRRLEHAMQDGEPHYGVNTGFGALGRVTIPESDLEQLQTNLIRSHSTGVGGLLPRECVRAMGVVLVASLVRGYSGVRLEVVERIVHILNQGITPVVPRVGSVGASGDLAPLAHFALAILGEGEVEFNGKRMSTNAAFASVGLQGMRLAAKEGLALINGTHLMTGRAAILVEDFRQLWKASLVAAAMSMDACRATTSTLDPRIHRVRGQLGQEFVAAELAELLDGSEIVKSHRENDPRVQDPYSFRCCPAVLGAVWDAFEYVQRCIASELGGVTDNPLVFGVGLEAKANGELVSGGNFHGMPIAIPLDVLTIAIAHLAGIAERRVFHMLSGIDPEAALPTFLTPQAGLQSGLMITQYTAAACCNEIVGLATPASIYNLSTSAGMEDYNSFGPRSVEKGARALELARSVVAIELLCAATGIDYHRPLRSGVRIERAHAQIRECVPPLTSDRSPASDISALEALISRGFS
jgi:histidine ammonia-lyase